MNTIIILGIKIPFKKLWKKINVIDKPVCNCIETPESYMYCPYCGKTKRTIKVKVYKSLLTNEETSYRNIEQLNTYAIKNNIHLYDTHPRGYTDEPVYIYLSEPLCYLEVKDDRHFNMSSVTENLYIKEMLMDIVGPEIWNNSEYGLWAFNTEVLNKVETSLSNINNTDDNEGHNSNFNLLRSLIIPIQPTP